MRSSTRIMAAAVAFFFSAAALAEPPREHLLRLSGQEMAGREVGTEGHDNARDYIQRAMSAAGLEPGAPDGSWYVDVSVVRRASLAPENALRIGEHVLAPGLGYLPRGFSDEATFDGVPVFVGYGLSAAQVGWDDYADVDVRGRIVFAFTGAPPRVLEALDPQDAYLVETASKAAVALGAGARAIIFVHDPRTHGSGSDQRPDTLAPLTPDFALRGIGVAMITARRGSEVFAEAGLDLARYQALLDRSIPSTVELPLRVSGHFRVEREIVESQNVVGKIDGTTDAPPVALGAHYDHLGLGGAGSRYDGPEVVHPGADDNASGVAVLLSVAARLSELPAPRRTMLFVATTGEERGLRGARQAAHVLRGPQAGTFVNLDMVGRLRDDVLHAYGVSDGADAALVGEHAAAAELRIEAHEREDSSSDHIAFHDRGWNAMSFSTGRHTDYHLPTDTIDKIVWSGLDRITAFVADLLLALAER